jgi:hypothetical protein
MADPSVPVHECTCPSCQTAPDSPGAAYHRQINLLLSRLTEPQRRWYVASLAADPTGPSATQLAAITGLSLSTIRRGRPSWRPAYPMRRPPANATRAGAARAPKKTTAAN